MRKISLASTNAPMQDLPRTGLKNPGVSGNLPVERKPQVEQLPSDQQWSGGGGECPKLYGSKAVAAV